MSKLRLSRRSLIAAIATLSGAGALHRVPGAAAQAPMSGGQAPFFYRFKLGELEGTVVSDGSVGPLGNAADLYSSAPKEELQQLLVDTFAEEQIVLEQDVLVLNVGGR